MLDSVIVESSSNNRITIGPIEINENEIEWSFARSSGKGGQNVNKVNSKAILRWNVSLSASLQEPVKNRLLAKLRGRLTNDGDLVLSSEKLRDQEKNKSDCLEKMRVLILNALHVPKKRIKTKPSKGSVKKRLQSKQRHGLKKQTRRTNSWE